MATALTPSPGPSQEVFKVQWSKELEQNVDPDGQLRNGPRYVPTGDTIEELIADVATHRGISVDDLLGSDPDKEEDGKKVGLADYTNCSDVDSMISSIASASSACRLC